ncbi:MAG TPA: thioesterase family protein, partial [Rhizobiaceae bacterium]|nr:thioesterase family protein [Rhizobiaceae bacterium]
NARYMMLADVGRIDIFLRSGLLGLARRNGWGPMMGGLQSVYVREIRLWRRFDVVSTIETWESTQVLGRHRFILDNGETAAIILTTAGVYDLRNRRFLEIAEVLETLGVGVRPREPDPAEQSFLASHQKLRRLAKTTG